MLIRSGQSLDLCVTEVSHMFKYDLVSGLLVGIVLGLVFTPQLSGHLALIVILAVIFGAKMIHIK